MSGKLTLNDLQSDGGLFGPSIHSPTATTVREEHRQSGRKPLHADGTVTVDGTAVPMTTTNISLGGLSLRSARQLVVGKEYALNFPLALDGGARQVSVAAEAVYCFFTVEQDFRTGLKFVRLASDLENAIRQFIDKPDA